MEGADGGELVSQINQVANPLEFVVKPLTVVGLVSRHFEWCVLECALERAKGSTSGTQHTNEIYRGGMMLRIQCGVPYGTTSRRLRAFPDPRAVLLSAETD